MATIPNPFALKSNETCKYLSCDPIDSKGVLKFCKEKCDPNFQTEKAKNPGYVYIKCLDNNKYLRRAPIQDGLLMIVATASTPNDNETHEDCTLFQFQLQPVNVEPNTDTICRIVHVQDHLYIRPCSIKGEDAVPCVVSPLPDPKEVDLLTVVGRK